MLNNKTVEDLLRVKEIYLEPEVRNYKKRAGDIREIFRSHSYRSSFSLENTRAPW